jgi:dihydrofolate reductase
MNRADRLEVTQVHASPQGDTFFEPIEPAVWEQVAISRHEKTADDSADVSYVTYRRLAH